MKKSYPKKWQWCMVITFSITISFGLYFCRVPAAFLLGPMLAGIILGLKHFDVFIPKSIFNLSQGILGCLTAKTINANVLNDLISYWPLALIMTISTIVICVGLGLFIMRFSTLPGSTAIWGIMPGGASAMVALSSDYGADPRLVALIQYLRVIFVVLLLGVFSHFFTFGSTVSELSNLEWFPTPNLNLLYTLLIAIIGVLLTNLIKFTAGRVLLPMVIGAILQIHDLVQLETPLWLLMFSFGTIGLSVGLRFNFAVIKLAIKTLPIILLSVFMMLIFCYGQAVLLHIYLYMDYLTCLLATSPGGLDTSVIIALDSRADLAVILPLQVLRFLSVLVFGPMIARYYSKQHINRK